MATKKLKLYRATACLRVNKGIGATDTFHVAAEDDGTATEIAEGQLEEGYKLVHLDCKGKVFIRER